MRTFLVKWEIDIEDDDVLTVKDAAERALARITSSEGGGCHVFMVKDKETNETFRVDLGTEEWREGEPVVQSLGFMPHKGEHLVGFSDAYYLFASPSSYRMRRVSDGFEARWETPAENARFLSSYMKAGGRMDRLSKVSSAWLDKAFLDRLGDGFADAFICPKDLEANFEKAA